MKNLEIKFDLCRYGANTFRTSMVVVFLHPGARFCYLFRNCRKYKKFSLMGLFFRFWFQALSSRKNVEIPHSTKIGKGLFLNHFKNITINSAAKIGENCNIMQGVTIGNESRGKRKGTPTIGDRVLIGPNSVVVGNINIGNDVLIGPLTLVNFDIPPNSLVLGNPAKIIAGKGSSGYIKNICREVLKTSEIK